MGSDADEARERVQMRDVVSTPFDGTHNPLVIPVAQMMEETARPNTFRSTTFDCNFYGIAQKALQTAWAQSCAAPQTDAELRERLLVALNGHAFSVCMGDSAETKGALLDAILPIIQRDRDAAVGRERGRAKRELDGCLLLKEQQIVGLEEERDAVVAGAKKETESAQKVLCADHAQVWYTARNTLKPVSGCVFCDMDAADAAALEQAEQQASRYAGGLEPGQTSITAHDAACAISDAIHALITPAQQTALAERLQQARKEQCEIDCGRIRCFGSLGQMGATADAVIGNPGLDPLGKALAVAWKESLVASLEQARDEATVEAFETPLRLDDYLAAKARLDAKEVKNEATRG